MAHGHDCTCERCEGIRRYPKLEMCSWCGTEHTGDSYNCPEEKTEDTLAGFVTNDTIEDEQLMWAVLGAVKTITKQVKENTMIPRATSASSPTSSNSRGQAVRTGLPYLNQQNMANFLELNVKYPVRLIECKVNQGATGNQSPVVLKLAIKGKTVLWGLRTNNPSLAELTEMFGDDENNWANQTFQMWLHEDEFDGRIWPTVGPAEKESKKNK